MLYILSAEHSAEHFTFIIALYSYNYSNVYYYPHFTDEETELWIDYFIYLTEDLTAIKAGT